MKWKFWRTESASNESDQSEAVNQIRNVRIILEQLIYDIGRQGWNEKVQESYSSKRDWEELDLVQNIHLLARLHRDKVSETEQLSRDLYQERAKIPEQRARENLEKDLKKAREVHSRMSTGLKNLESRLRTAEKKEAQWQITEDFFKKEVQDLKEERQKANEEERRLQRHMDEVQARTAAEIELLKNDLIIASQLQSDWELAQERYEEQITDLTQNRNEAFEKTFSLEQEVEDLQSQVQSACEAQSQLFGQLKTLKICLVDTQQEYDAAQIKWTEERGYLRREIEKRMKALVVVGDITYLNDVQLESKFADLVQTVDTLSRCSWSHNHSGWTDEMLSELSASTKKSQKWVLKDTIWSTFYEKIFCTPFRVLGEEGLDAEKKWIQGFDKETETKSGRYAWPKPSFESEKWRREIMRECLEALERPPTEHHQQRKKLLDGYENSLSDTQTHLAGLFENVVELDATTNESIRKACAEASRLWVLFGSQKCRLVVSDYSSKVLVIQPELQRVGNSGGIHFDEVVTVTGCEAELVHIKPTKKGKSTD